MAGDAGQHGRGWGASSTPGTPPGAAVSAPPTLPTRMAAAQEEGTPGKLLLSFSINVAIVPGCTAGQWRFAYMRFPGHTPPPPLHRHPPPIQSPLCPGREAGKVYLGGPPRTTGRRGGLCLFRAGPALQPPRWLHGTTLPPTGNEESVALTGPDQGSVRWGFRSRRDTWKVPGEHLGGGGRGARPGGGFAV